METVLNILHIEDCPTDFLLVERHLEAEGIPARCHRVADRSALETAWQSRHWDIVVSDYNVPSVSFVDTLKLLQPRLEEIPLILLSGSVGEETAVELLKLGVWDFVLKENLSRLVPAIRRDLREAADRRARRLAELAVREREARLQAVIRAAPTGIGVLADRVFQDVNQRVLEMTGYTREELVGVGARLLYLSTEEHHRVDSIKHRVPTAGAANIVETQWRRKDGSIVDILLSASPIDFADPNKGITFTSLDITDRKRSEEILRQSEEQFRAIFEMASIGMAQADPGTSRFLRVNRKICEITGYTEAELLQKSVPDITHLEDRDVDQNRFQALVRGEIPSYQIEKRYLRKDNSIAWVNLNVTILRDASGRPTRTMATIEDITERKQMELQLRQAQKLEAIGQLAGGVAHDFNNILTAILMQVELSRMEENLSPEIRESFQQIQSDAERAASLTRQLLLFSRRQIMQPRDLNLNEMVTNLVKMLQRIIGEDVHLQLQLSPAELLTRADPGMLDQVVMNLSVNARDAMPGGGHLTITTTEEIILHESAGNHPDSRPGRFVCLAVTDTGCGIPAEIIPHIFEPFFTTKEAGKGTGLGLATVFGIVKQHHGWVTLETQAGRGTTFKIYLPAIAASHAPAEIISTPQPDGGHETILLVEDEAIVRQNVRTLLTRHGYHVLEAAHGRDALEIWAQNHAQIALVITDLVMPGGVSGTALGRQLQSRKPSLKVIYISGYSAEIAGREIPLRSSENFLQKPFRPHDLLKTVRTCLDTHPSPAINGHTPHPAPAAEK